ncbi:MAG: DUF4919 domain-containing protein [Acidobacteria bacterium]|nr:DUF4919 domain-containing protein [Acidobacteriota bacterium]
MLRNTLAAAFLLLLAAPALYAQTPQAQPTPTPQTQQSPPGESKAGGKPSDGAKSVYKSPGDAKKKYEALRERAKKGDQTVDYKEMRLAFFETPEYSPLTGMIDNRALNIALGQGDYAGAIKTADAILKKNFVDLNAHMVAHIGYRQTGNEEKASFHRSIADALLNSIKSTGDGKSTDTAYEVISISEEYAMFRGMGLRPVKQALVNEKGHAFDAITVVDPKTKQEAIIYFNVDKPFSAYGRK